MTPMDEFREKIARLPAWTREYIKRLEAQAQPNNEELLHLRKRVEQAEERTKLCQARMDAMTEIFRCAARGGSETAQAFVDRILNEWDVVS